MKYLFKKDTILATIAVFVVMGLFSLIKINTHVLDPIKLALTDVSYNDLSFSPLKAHKDNASNNNIVIINAGHAGRDSITALLKYLRDAGTKAVGLDLLFLEPGDSIADAELRSVITTFPNLVIASKIDFSDSGYNMHGIFDDSAANKGYVNFIGEERGVIRYFAPVETWNGKEAQSFSSAIVKTADPAAHEKLMQRSHEVEFINYSRKADQYFVVDHGAVLTGQTDSNFFRNKIVLVGYIAVSADDIEDKHFTPLNEKFTGKSIPDMNGVIIHANIISMIVSGTYINKIPVWLSFLISVLFTWVFMAYTIKFFLEKHLWFHLIMKSIQLVLTVLFVYLGLIIRSTAGYSVSFSILIIAIVLAVDVLYFYDAFAKWLHRKFGVKTIFINAHH